MSTPAEVFAMERQAIERMVGRWMQEAIAKGQLETFDELLAEDVLDRSGPTPSRGVAPFKARTAAVCAAFADIDVQVEDLLVEGDAIVWRWALTGTHVGPFAGLAPTGRRIVLRGVNFQRLQNGRVSEHWTMADVFGAMQALTR
jgi:steroid delta-isomerase-like uncharacterized protein